MDCCVRIERIQNGYTVCVDDPKIKADNAKPNSKWRSAQKEYSFKNIKEVLAFLQKNLDKALPQDDYGSSFDAAVAAPSED